MIQTTNTNLNEKNYNEITFLDLNLNHNFQQLHNGLGESNLIQNKGNSTIRNNLSENISKKLLK